MEHSTTPLTPDTAAADAAVFAKNLSVALGQKSTAENPAQLVPTSATNPYPYRLDLPCEAGVVAVSDDDGDIEGL